MENPNYDYQAETPEEVHNDSFTIDTPDLANWAFKKIKQLNNAIEDKEAYAKREKERIDEWLKKETQPDKDSVAFFETHLVTYYQRLQAEDPKAKLSTPHGKVQSRKRQPKWEFDDDKMISYLQEADPDKLELQYKYNKTEIKKALQLLETETDMKVIDENGQLLDFIRVTPQGPSYTVKVED